jgi:Lhr-like helicase
MVRAYLIILVLQLGFIFQGCAALEYFDGSSKEETERLKMSKNQMWNEMEKLKIENAKSQEQINILIEQNQEMSRKRDKNELLNEQVSKLKEENRVIRDQNQALTKKLDGLQLKYNTLSSKSYDMGTDIRRTKIKVLSGDGNLNSAKYMAKRLKNMGYKIRLIDRASKPSFLRNTVFFAPEFQHEAKRLVSRLGGNTIAKPLNWYSIFDLIVVTGKNP